jgi:hypothetical protein
MTPAAVLALALTCPTLPVSLAPVMVGIAMHENPQLDPRAINHNKNGTDDLGLAQVNTINLGWTNLKDPFDPCQNLTAASKVLFSKYNGNPPDGVKALYAAGVMARLARLPEAPAPEAPAPEAISSQPPAIYPRPAHGGRDIVYGN